MKKQFIAAVQEGDTINDYFLAARKDLRKQANGNRFLGMVFKDRSGEIGGIACKNAVSMARQFEVGDVVNVCGAVTSYQKRLQIRVEQVLPLRESEYDTEDLVTSPGLGDANSGACGNVEDMNKDGASSESNAPPEWKKRRGDEYERIDSTASLIGTSVIRAKKTRKVQSVDQSAAKLLIGKATKEPGNTKTPMTNILRETFRTDHRAICPYPFCGGTIEVNRCSQCLRSVKQCASGPCKAWNGLDARYCRICGKPLPSPVNRDWPMQGGNCGRTSYNSTVNKQLQSGEASWTALGEYGLVTGLAGDVPHPLKVCEDLVLPNPAQSGFSLYSPMQKRTIWTCGLGINLTVSSTPVRYGPHLFTCLDDDGIVLCAMVPLDSGEPTFLSTIESSLSPKQTPVCMVSPTGGAALAWALKDGVAVARLANGLALNNGATFPLTPLWCPHLNEDEQLFSPVGMGDMCYLSSSRGQVFGFEWNVSANALRFCGAPRMARLKGNWQCGPPMALSKTTMVFLASNRDEGRAEYLAVFQPPDKLESIALRDNQGTVEHPPADAAVLQERLLFCDGNLFVPSTHNQGLYRLSLPEGGKVRLAWKPSKRLLNGCRFVGSSGLCVAIKNSELLVLRNLFDNAALDFQVVNLVQGTGLNNSRAALADPILCDNALYALCDGYLLEIPLK